MPTISIPADMATDLAHALRFASDTPAGETFRALVAAGTAWRPARVRQMIAWAERRRVYAAETGERFLTVVLAGFAGAECRERMRAAKQVLRAAAARVASGEESPLLTGELLWVIGDEPPAPNWDALWSWDGRGPHDPNPVLPATRADIAAANAFASFGPAPSAPSPSVPGSRPGLGMPGRR
jgi:hypothetical protein